MSYNYVPPNKGLLQDLQSKRQKMETVNRHMVTPVSTTGVPSLTAPLTRSLLMPSFTNNPQPAAKPKPLKVFIPPPHSLCIHGNLYLFIDRRKEPEKPDE